jgi:hypothetical protein
VTTSHHAPCRVSAGTSRSQENIEWRPPNSGRGAARLLAEAFKTAARAGADPRAGTLVIMRADSGPTVKTSSRRRCVLGPGSPSRPDGPGRAPCEHGDPRHGLDADPLPERGLHEQEQRLISDTEVAETGFTAFTSRPQREHVHAQVIMHRIKTAQPRRRASRSGHTVHDLVSPRGVHEQSDAAALGRDLPPGTHHHRAGHRRAESWTLAESKTINEIQDPRLSGSRPGRCL